MWCEQGTEGLCRLRYIKLRGSRYPDGLKVEGLRMLE
jgi:hypothetical protein